jgi:archaellum component FlaC
MFIYSEGIMDKNQIQYEHLMTMVESAVESAQPFPDQFSHKTEWLIDDVSKYLREILELPPI